MRFFNERNYGHNLLLEPATAVIAAGTVLSAAGASKQADAERKALRGQAALQRAQADERLRQLETEIDIFKSRGEVAFGETASSYAKAGVDVGSGSPLLVLANTEREINTGLAELERKGLAEVDLIRRGAGQLNSAARNVDPSLSIAGSVLGGIGNIIGSSKPGGSE